MKIFSLISSLTITSLLCAEVALASNPARATELRPKQQLKEETDSYRCANDSNTGVVRLRLPLSGSTGQPTRMIVDQYSNVETYEISGSSGVRGGTKYTAYDGDSNLTYDFIQYPAGHGEFIFSLELPDGRAQVENRMDCVKIG